MNIAKKIASPLAPPILLASPWWRRNWLFRSVLQSSLCTPPNQAEVPIFVHCENDTLQRWAPQNKRSVDHACRQADPAVLVSRQPGRCQRRLEIGRGACSNFQTSAPINHRLNRWCFDHIRQFIHYRLQSWQLSDFPVWHGSSRVHDLDWAFPFCQPPPCERFPQFFFSARRRH